MKLASLNWLAVLGVWVYCSGVVWGQSVGLGGGLLLVDEGVEPTVTVRWVSDGGERSVSGVLGYGPPSGGEVMVGKVDDENREGNIRGYVALGGTRVDTGAGHPKGLVLRAGLTKVMNARPWFEDIVAGSLIEIEMSGVVMNQGVKYHQGTGMMHLKYAIGDLEACSLPGTARNQYLLSDPKDTLGGRVVAGVNATPGALDGGDGRGEFTIRVDEEDPARVGFVVRVPYGMLRHLQDPWDSTLPGTFFEPIHFHMEAEVIPVRAQPFDREWVLEENSSSDQSIEDQIEEGDD